MIYRLVSAGTSKGLERDMNELARDGWILIGEVKYNRLFWYVTMGKDEPEGFVGESVD